LANRNEINSTEKLLNVIRGGNSDSDISLENSLNKPSKQKSEKSNIVLPSIFTSKKRFTIGVEIGHESINMAKTTPSNDGKNLLVDQKRVQYSPRLTKGSPEFNNLLKSLLHEFAGSMELCDFWTTVTTGDFNVQYIKIPKVPKKQLENVIFWTAKKESPFDEKEVIFDYELQGEISDQGIPRYLVMVYTIPRTEIEKIKELFVNIDVPLSGITIAPFAIQNIFRSKWVKPEEPTFASLFIGNDFSRIDIYSKDNLVMTRGIKTGVSSMMEAIEESIAEKPGGVKFNKNDVRSILYSLGNDTASKPDMNLPVKFSKDEIFEMIEPVLERLSRQIERTLEYYSSSVGKEKVGLIYVSTTIVVYGSLLSFLNEQLGIKTEYFDPFMSQVTSSSVKDISISERVAIVPAIGAALSENSRTPNLIFTYVEEYQEITRKRINRTIFASFGVILLICLITLIVQSMETFSLGHQKAQLQKDLALHNPILSTEKVSKLANDVKTQRHLTRQYSQKYLGLAVIGEISALTPENIKLLNIRINTFTGSGQDKTENKEKKDDVVVIEGVVLGDRNILDSFLAQYVMKLDNSPMLKEVTLQKNTVILFKKNDVLHFTLSLKIG
jgi:Tfp pilus assembly PilM family ATPase